MRQYIEVDGRKMQKRAKGKAESYSLCPGCMHRDMKLFPCKTPIGMANFCAATKVKIVIFACPDFVAIEEEKEDEV